MTAAQRSTFCAGSESPSTRASTISRNVGGMEAWYASSTASSSSAKKALPSERRYVRSTSSADGSLPTIAEMSSRTSSRSKRASSIRSTAPERSSSASRPRNGWRRWRSSERYVPTSTIDAVRRLRARYTNNSRVDRSAQWRSSSTSNVGTRSVSRSNTPSSCSNSAPATMPSRAGVWSSGSRTASSSRPGPMTASSVASSSVRCSVRITCTIGPKGNARSTRSKHWPTSTSDGSGMRATSSATSRDLPTPASPDRSTVAARSSTTAAFQLSSSRVSSARRPTNRELETRAGTAFSLVQPPSAPRPDSDARRRSRSCGLRNTGRPAPSAEPGHRRHLQPMEVPGAGAGPGPRPDRPPLGDAAARVERLRVVA